MSKIGFAIKWKTVKKFLLAPLQFVANFHPQFLVYFDTI